MAKPTKYFDNWKHGFIRIDKRGRKTYLIRVQRDGRRLTISTGAHSEVTATQEYERWLEDPDNYQRGGALRPSDPSKKPLELTRTLVDEFLAWSKERGSRGHGNTPGHIANQRIAMDFWLRHLPGRNLKKLDIQADILPALKGLPQQANRRRTLRGFYSWLRSEDGGYRVKLSEDPTFKAIKVPTSDPRRRKKKNKAVAWQHLIAVRDALLKVEESSSQRTKKGTYAAGRTEAPWGSIFRVQMATGWHETELARFGSDGEILTYEGPMKNAVAVIVCPWHKSGGEFRTAVGAETLKAAKALREYGSFSPANYSKAVKQAALAVVDEPFTAGQLRHSVATHMIAQGATVYEVSTFLGHKSLETTKKFYATHAIPWNPMLGVNPLRVRTGEAA